MEKAKIWNGFSNQGEKLIRKKFIEFLPIVFLSGMSTLLLLIVDGVVAGNLVGAEALAAVNMIAPITAVLSVLNDIASGSLSVSLSLAVGENNKDKIMSVCKMGVVNTIACSILMLLLGFPGFMIMIKAYGAGNALQSAATSYSIGILVALVVGCFSVLGTSYLISIGKMKVLLQLAIIEGVVNLVFDLLFMGPLKMGVAGAGYGTMVANIVRATLTIIYLAKNTKIFKYFKKGKASSYPKYLSNGLNTAMNALCKALSVYFINMIIIRTLANEGMVVRSVTSFCVTVGSIVYMSITNSASPLIGLFTGMKDNKASKKALKNAVFAVIIILGILTAFVIIFPSVPFSINGVKEYPNYGHMAVIATVCGFVFQGFNMLVRSFLTYYQKKKTAVFLSILESVVFCLILSFAFSKIENTWIFIALPVSALLTTIIGIFILMPILNKKDDRDIVSIDLDNDTAKTASVFVSDYYKDLNYSERLVYKLSVAVEEIVAYAKGKTDNSNIVFYLGVAAKITKLR